jgi:H+/Cl- antiporter ClcA/predicted transcriptional regulator
MGVWFISALVGALAGVVAPTSWFFLEKFDQFIHGADFGFIGSGFFLPCFLAGVVFLLQYVLDAFRTADSFTYFFSELHYNEGRRNFRVSLVHGAGGFLVFVGGGVVGMESLVYESVSAIACRLAESLGLQGIALRTISTAAMASALAAMLELPTPAIFFVVEILIGWTGLASAIGPIALASILAAGVSSAFTGPLGYLQLQSGTDGGLALAMRGASLEIGNFEALYAFTLVSLVAALAASVTIWLYQRTDYVLALFLATKQSPKAISVANGVRLAAWALVTGAVLELYPEAGGLGMKLLQSSMWEQSTPLGAVAILLVRLGLGVFTYCALGSIGVVLPTLVFGSLLGAYLAQHTVVFLGVSSVHMALLMMGAYFSAAFGTPIAATALVFSYAGGTSSENPLFLLSVVGANFLSHALTGVLHKDRLAAIGLYRHEIRFRNGLCFNTLSSVTVKDAMISWVVPIPKASSIGAAYNSMMESRFLKLPVVDDQKKLCGMLSLADFYNLVAWRNLDASSQVQDLLGIEDIMKPVSHQVESTMSLEEALTLMGDEEIVPVVEEKTQLFTGLLVKSDVIHIYNKEVVKKASGRGRFYR